MGAKPAGKQRTVGKSSPLQLADLDRLPGGTRVRRSAGESRMVRGRRVSGAKSSGPRL